MLLHLIAVALFVGSIAVPFACCGLCIGCEEARNAAIASDYICVVHSPVRTKNFKQSIVLCCSQHR